MIHGNRNLHVIDYQRQANSIILNPSTTGDCSKDARHKRDGTQVTDRTIHTIFTLTRVEHTNRHLLPKAIFIDVYMNCTYPALSNV